MAAGRRFRAVHTVCGRAVVDAAVTATRRARAGLRRHVAGDGRQRSTQSNSHTWSARQLGSVASCAGHERGPCPAHRSATACKGVANNTCQAHPAGRANAAIAKYLRRADSAAVAARKRADLSPSHAVRPGHMPMQAAGHRCAPAGWPPPRRELYTRTRGCTQSCAGF